MKPPDEVQILLREVCMAYTHHEWPGIIGLDLSKKTRFQFIVSGIFVFENGALCIHFLFFSYIV